MTKWLHSAMAVGVLLIVSMAVSAKPLPPFALELEPVDPQPLPASVRFVVHVQAFQDLKNVDLSFLLPAGISTASQTRWSLTLKAGQPQQFELVLPLNHWPTPAIGAQLRLINGDEQFTVTDYFVQPGGQSSKATRDQSDVLRERDGRTVRERPL